MQLSPRDPPRAIMTLEAARQYPSDLGPTRFCVVETCGELISQEAGILATREDTGIPPISYFHLVSNFLKPEKPTKAEMGLIKKTAEVMKLNQQINSNSKNW